MATPVIQKPGYAPPTGAALYARFALAGAICCGVTHGSMTPIGNLSLFLSPTTRTLLHLQKFFRFDEQKN